MVPGRCKMVASNVKYKQSAINGGKHANPAVWSLQLSSLLLLWCHCTSKGGCFARMTHDATPGFTSLSQAACDCLVQNCICKSTVFVSAMVSNSNITGSLKSFFGGEGVPTDDYCIKHINTLSTVHLY